MIARTALAAEYANISERPNNACNVLTSYCFQAATMAQAASQSLLNYLRGEGPGYNMRIVTAVADTTTDQVSYSNNAYNRYMSSN
jgi:hypothetical protein